jgi:Lon protease-like protein
VGRLTSFSETDDGRYLITLTGIARFRLGRELQVKSPYRQVEALWDDFAGDLAGPDAPVGFDRERLSRVLRDYLGRRGLSADWDSISSADPEPLVNGLAAMCPFSTAERQGLLEAESLEDRARMLTTLLEIAAAGDAGEDGDAPLQ